MDSWGLSTSLSISGRNKKWLPAFYGKFINAAYYSAQGVFCKWSDHVYPVFFFDLLLRREDGVHWQ